MEDEFLLSGDVVSISGRNADDDKLLGLDDLTDQAYLDETAQDFGVAFSADVRASPEGVPDLEDVPRSSSSVRSRRRACRAPSRGRPSL